MAAIVSICLFYWQAKVNKKIIGFFAFISSWFLTEILIVKIVFDTNEFSYGSLLGFKMLGVPIAIGLIWFIAFLSSISITSYGNLNNVKKYSLAAFLILMFTLTFHQFAGSFNILQWVGGQAPFIFYLIWALFSLTAVFLIDKYVKINRPSIFIASMLPVLSIYFWLLGLLS
jgi:hypothetical protein